jgi:hypothetical protein
MHALATHTCWRRALARDPRATHPLPPAVSTPTVLSGFWSTLTPQIMAAASYCASARVGT